MEPNTLIEEAEAGAEASVLGTAIPECKHVSHLHGALASRVPELPAKGNHDFRVPVGEGRELRVSLVDYPSNPGGIFETLLFDSKGMSVCVVGDEDIDRDRGGDGVRRFFVGGGGHVEDIAAHIEALREHFRWVGAGGAAAARSVFDDTDQDSDRTGDNMRKRKSEADPINYVTASNKTASNKLHYQTSPRVGLPSSYNMNSPDECTCVSHLGDIRAIMCDSCLDKWDAGMGAAAAGKMDETPGEMGAAALAAGKMDETPVGTKIPCPSLGPHRHAKRHAAGLLDQ